MRKIFFMSHLSTAGNNLRGGIYFLFGFGIRYLWRMRPTANTKCTQVETWERVKAGGPSKDDEEFPVAITARGASREGVRRYIAMDRLDCSDF